MRRGWPGLPLLCAAAVLPLLRAAAAPASPPECLKSAHGKDKGPRRGTSEEDDEDEVAASDKDDKDAHAVLLLPLLRNLLSCRGGSSASIRPTAEPHPPLGARDSTATAHHRAASVVGRL
jgi:hypothetical protein